MNRAIRTAILILFILLLMLPAGSFAYGDSYLIGDVDGDGEITTKDANHITRYLANFENLDPAQRSRADFDGDGTITSYDANMILSALVTTEVLPTAKWSFSMIVSSDMKGEAWGSVSADEAGGASALNLITYVQSEREQESDILLLDAGGSLFGSAISDDYTLYTHKRVGPITRIFQELNYDAVMFGTEAVTYQSQMVRNEMDVLTKQGTSVFGANLTKVYPNLADPDPAMWNDILPYSILEAQQPDEKTVRIGLIGIVEPDLAEPYDEVRASDPVAAFELCKTELKGKCDICILLYYGNIESDESQNDVYSLNKLLRQISDVDMVLVSHSTGGNVRVAQDAHGRDVPVIALAGGSQHVTRLSVMSRENGAIVYNAQTVDLHDFAPDETMQQQIKSYVTAMSEMMDARIGTLEARIEPFAPDTLGATDGMELVHEMQIWGAQQWIRESGIDLPPTVISIAYPYLDTSEWNAGTLRYRDLCTRKITMPRYTMMLVRGSELRDWLTAYAERITSEETVYSLYGLSYLLNTLNPETPLGYLEYSSGLAVQGEEVFTLILAEEPGPENLLEPYLDETWMSYEDRIVTDFSMPSPKQIATSEVYRNADTIAAFFESVGTFSLKHETGWLVI